MSSVDERVVAMKMDYASFDKGVSATTSALDKLKKALSFDKEAKGLNDLDSAGKKFSMAGIADGVDAIVGKFSALSLMGITALTNIANKAVDAGLTIAKSLTIDPIKAGFDEYELKMGSIQTILANTARYGTSLSQVTDSLDELNTYADKTIYNFGDMTKNIGLFTNAGIRVEDATSMIKGFSNEAAASGTSAQGAAGAAYQLSQALSAGTIRLMDWRSLTNVGMGNKNMQNGLIEIADAMGTLTANSIDAATVQSDFNGSLEKNWLSADVMSTYLKIMAGEMDAASMAAMGLTDAQIAMFQQQATTAEEAATKVRTWTQLIGTLQEGVGSGWAQTFDILIGDFDTATDLWTGVNDKLGPIIEGMSKARNKFAQAFVDAGGRDAVIGTLSSAFDTLMSIIRVVQRAFKEIFPPMTGKQLAEMAESVRSFVESLKPSPEQLVQVKNAAKGLFAILDIGWMVIKGVAGVFGDLFNAVSPVGGGLLEMAGNVGKALVSFRDMIKDGSIIEKTFDKIGEVLGNVVGWLRKLGEATVDTLSFENFGKIWRGIADAFQAVVKFLSPAVEWVKEAFVQVRDAVGEFFKTMDFNVLIGLLNVGAIGTVAVLIKKGFDKIVDALGGLFKGGGGSSIKDMIKDVFGSLTETFAQMQATLKSTTLLVIATAIGILTASVVALSFIDTGKLFVVLGALGVMFAELSGAMVILDKFAMKGEAVKMAVIGGAMVGLGVSMLLLAAAAKIMASLDWNELARGVVGLAAGMAIMVGALAALDRLKFSPEGAGQIVLLSAALVIIASAFKIMSTLSWDDILRSVATMTVALGALVGVMVIIDKLKFSPTGAASILGMSIALTIVAGALKVFASMSWDEIGRAMAVFGGVIVGLVGALLILDTLKFSPVGAATMIAMAAAINMLIVPMKAFGSMSWDEIGRAMVVLAGSLLILAGAMALMGIPIVLLGAIGIVAAAGALMVLAPAMKILGSMSWDDIGRGLTVLAAALVILAAGGVLLIAALPGLLGLGIAIALIGVGVLAAGIGLGLLAAGVLAFAAAATVGLDAIKMVVMGLIELIPSAMAAFAQGLIDFALVIANGGTEFTKAMTTLLQSLLDTINTMAPQLIDTIWNLIVLMVEKIVEGVPYLVDAGMRLLIGLINGIEKQLPALMDSATNLIVSFVTQLGNNAYRIVTAGGEAALKFIVGLANWIDANSGQFNAAGTKLFRAIVNGVSSAIENGGNLLRWAGERIGNAIIEGAKNALAINSPSKVFRDYIMGAVYEGLDDGNTSRLHRAANAGTEIGESLIGATEKALSKINLGLDANMDLNPIVTPVLDLTSFQSTADSMNGMLTTPKLNLDASYASANMAYEAVDAFRYATEKTKGDAGSTNITYIQNNSSPKALSETEIYRRTKNQLSTTKTERKG